MNLARSKLIESMSVKYDTKYHIINISDVSSTLIIEIEYTQDLHDKFEPLEFSTLWHA